MYIKKDYLLISIPILLVIICYINTINGSFVFDDIDVIVDDANIQDIKNILYLFTIKAQHKNNNYRPIPSVLHAIDYALWGLNPKGYHITNIILHALNTMLIFFIIRTHFSSINYEKGILFPLLCASYFAVHPVCTESVSYIKNREELLAFLFFISAFFLWLKAAGKEEQPVPNHRRRYIFFGSSILYTAAVFSKEHTIILPVVCISYGLIFLQYKGIKTLKDWGMHYYICFALIGIVPSLIFKYHGYDRISTVYTAPEGMDIILTVISTYWHYTLLMLLPINQSIDRTFIIYSPFKTLLIIFMGAALMFFLWKKIYPLLFFYIWYVVGILPVSNIIYFETRQVAEQRVYLSAFALSAGLAYMTLKITDKRRRIFLNIAFISIFCMLTINRNKVWNSSLALWRDAALKSPHKERTMFNYAKQLFKAGYKDSALDIFLSLMNTGPRSEGYNYIGNIYAEKKLYKEAAKSFRKAISISPKNIEAYTNLATLYMNNKKYDDALQVFMQVSVLRPVSSWYADQNIGIIHIEKGNINKAIYYLKKSLAIKKEDFSLYKLAEAYEYAGNYKEAISRYNSIDSNSYLMKSVYYKRGSIYLNTGNPEKAADDLERFIKEFPRSKEGLNNLANAYVLLGKTEEAIKQYNTALSYYPNSSITLFNLARTYYSIKRFADAEKALIKAVEVNPGLTEAHILRITIAIETNQFIKAKKLIYDIYGQKRISEEAKDIFINKLKAAEADG